MTNKEQAIKEFSIQHNLRIPEYLQADEDCFYGLIEVRQAISHGLRLRVGELLDEGESTWAITQAMLDRAYEHVEGAFVSLFTGSWASVEIICRAALEASINILYVLESDTVNRVSQYFSNYFEEASKAIDRYEHINCETQHDSNQQKCHADRARNALQTRRKIMEAVFKTDGISWDVSGWPKQIAQRFKQTSREREYRGLYATLSSQAHNDADALIDYIMLTTMGKYIDHSDEMTAKEMLCWLRTFIYSSCSIYTAAALSYTQHYRLPESATSLLSYQHSLSNKIKELDETLSSYDTSA